MKPHVHIERDWSSLEECKHIIDEFGPKCKRDSYPNGKPFYYLSHFFTMDELSQCFPNYIVRVQSLIDNYESKYPEVRYASGRYGLSEVRLQRYLPGENFNEFHFEHGYNTPYRVFNFILYLSDNNCGTEFYTGEVEKTEPGKVMMFPTQFTHCHKGQIDLEEKERYIITGYFNYYNEMKVGD